MSLIYNRLSLIRFIVKRNTNHTKRFIIRFKKSQMCPSLLGLRPFRNLRKTTGATSAKPVLRQCASCAGYLYRLQLERRTRASVGLQLKFGGAPPEKENVG
jgi:hypothetical protein